MWLRWLCSRKVGLGGGLLPAGVWSGRRTALPAGVSSGAGGLPPSGCLVWAANCLPAGVWSGTCRLLSWRVFALECDAEFPRSGKLSLSAKQLSKKSSRVQRTQENVGLISSGLWVKSSCVFIPEPQHADPRMSKVSKLPFSPLRTGQERKQAQKG